MRRVAPFSRALVGGGVLGMLAVLVAGAGALAGCDALLDDFVYDDGGPNEPETSASTDAALAGTVGDADADAAPDAKDAPDATFDGASDSGAGPDASGDAAAGMSRYSAAVLNSNPLVYWRFGEQVGRNAYSATGDGAYAATYVDDITLGVPGAIANDPDTAIRLDGMSGVVQLMADFSVFDDQIFAVEMWIRPTAPPSTAYQWMVKSLGPNTQVYELYKGNPGSSLVGEAVTSVSDSQDISPTDAVVGNWSYLVLQSTGTQLDLFLNAVQVASSSAPAPVDGGKPAMATNFNIGGDEMGFSTFTGDLDEVAVYDRPLTAVQMKVHFDLARGIDAGP